MPSYFLISLFHFEAGSGILGGVIPFHAVELQSKHSTLKMDPPVQIGQYVLGKNLGIGAFGKVSYEKAAFQPAVRIKGVSSCNCSCLGP